jgi:transposase-like protein
MHPDNQQIGADEGPGLVGKKTGGQMCRRHWSPKQKARIIAEILAPGAKMSEVARRHGMSTGLLSTWRRKAAAARRAANGHVGPAFVPVVMSEEGGVADVVIRLRGGVDAAALSMVLLCCGGEHDPDPCRPAHVVASQPVDFRSGIDLLVALAATTFQADVFGGDLHVFRSKRADRVKIRLSDGTGLGALSQASGAGAVCLAADPRRSRRTVVAAQPVGDGQSGGLASR